MILKKERKLMILFKQQVTKKEKKDLSILLDELTDVYRDFYITKDNLRLFIKDNKDVFFKALSDGDKIIYEEKYGIIFITGWCDNAKRKYIRILARNPRSADKLLKVLNWNFNIPLYIKIKKNNPLQSILKKNGFKFRGNRGKEILLVRKPIGEN